MRGGYGSGVDGAVDDIRAGGQVQDVEIAVQQEYDFVAMANLDRRSVRHVAQEDPALP